MTSLHTPLCDMLEIEYPILLAGMGGGRDDFMPSPPALAAAVSNAGGLGVMGCGSRKLETIEWCIREFRRLSDRPLGIDLISPATLAEAKAPTKAEQREVIKRDYPAHWQFVSELYDRFEITKIDLPTELEEEPPQSWDLIRQQAEVVFDHKVPVVVAGQGDPGIIVERAHDVGMKLGGMVGAVRHARRQKAAGVDFIVAQGTEAGGHTGNVATFPLIPQVVDEVAPIPVMAAGGIATGRHVAAALTLGAQAVWVGTAFLVAEENEIRDVHQEQILDARSERFMASKYPTGKQSRSLDNPLKHAWEESGLPALQMPFQGILMEQFGRSAEAAERWDLDTGPGGQVGGMLKERKPARQIVEEMLAEAEETLDRLRTYR